MFSIFRRKVFLVDYLHGLIDIHNHILPGIDDGAKNTDESLAMIKAFAEFGVKNFVFTPHIMNHYYPNTPKTIMASYEILQEAIDKSGIQDVRTAYAAEHMVDDEFEALLKANNIVSLKSQHLLIEMSYLQPSFGFDHAVRKILERPYFPVLAHPERYNYYHKEPEVYKELKSQGVQFQLNLLSLSGYYGSEIQKMAVKLLNEGLIDYCASDAHNMKHIEAIKEIRISRKVLSKILPVVENTIQTFF
ncbi:tyrosine-protein phosphatase [Flagellimonas myxillae]|uniref:tyrosine-protein phosphatase n=1 Tax=Flagellimonas myxillae TaxID=2942214 RepID=UPI00201F6613|nr:CpsB/CapC family capsule biosynthesis tyrosine phosphatase [Muricauda myxillae]MCL6266214.1 histidinol phosphatase [Muricauda myxillae]